MDAPAGYAPHTSGLLVPEAVARTRVVWTRDEWKLIDRAAKVLRERGVATLMRCNEPGCPQRVLEAVQLPGVLVLQCGCTDRVLTGRAS